MTAFTVLVGALDVTNALRAVAPFTDKNVDSLSRVRVTCTDSVVAGWTARLTRLPRRSRLRAVDEAEAVTS